MAKLLSSSCINGNISKIVELADEYIINGHTYDKSSFAPKPLDFCPVITSGWNEPMFYNTVNIDSYYNYNRNKNNVMIDCNDPSICWVTQLAGTWQSTSYIYKFQRTALGLQCTPINCSDYYPTYELISQTSDRIYFLCQRLYDTNAYRQNFIGSINKTTLGVELVAQIGGQQRTKILKDTPGFIYFTSSVVNNGFCVQKYNKTTGVVTTLLTDNKSGYHVLQLPSDPIISGNTCTFFATRDGFYKENINHFNCVRKYILALDTEVVTVSDVTLNVDILGSIPFAQIIENSLNVAYELLQVQDNGKNYMTLIIYNYGINGQVALNPNRCASYTFLMNSDDNWTLTSYNKFSPYVYSGLLPMFNNKLMILSSIDAVTFWNWNTSIQGYQKTAQYSVSPRIIGADLNNNIWVYKSDRSMEILSNTLPIDIYADYIQDDYQYQGTDIDTQITVYARNYTGQYLTSNLQLTLVGPAKFTDTGLKTKNITTSNLNPISIPVTVTDKGMLFVNPKLM